MRKTRIITGLVSAAILIAMLSLISNASANTPGANSPPSKAPVPTQPPQLNINDYPHGPTPPMNAHPVVKIKNKALKEKLLKEHPIPNNVVMTPAASGALPYAGSKWGGLRTDGFVTACTWGISATSADGRLFGMTAGHCFKNANGTVNLIDPNNGQFKYPYTTCWGPGCPPVNIGNAGHAGARYDTCCDRGAIRVNLKAPLYAEAGTFDTRGAVNIIGVNPPTDLEDVSCSCGQSRRLIHGFITKTATTSLFEGNPNKVGNQAEFEAYQGQGCAISGDSGGAIITADHRWLGTLSGFSLADGICLMAFDRGFGSMGAMGLTPAPLPPA